MISQGGANRGRSATVTASFDRCSSIVQAEVLDIAVSPAGGKSFAVGAYATAFAVGERKFDRLVAF